MGTRELVEGDETPDVADLQGRDGADPAIPVRVEGPVEVRQMPARSSATRNVAVTSAEPVRLLHADLTRRRAYIRAQTQSIYLAFTREEAAGTDCWLMAATDPPLAIESACEMWVRAVGTATVAQAISENWTV